MYTGSSISAAAIVEHLLNMTRDVEDLVYTVKRVLNRETRVRAETIEKLYRQEILPYKGTLENMTSKLFEFLASGRLTLVDMSEYYLNSAIQLERAGQSIEASVYRLLLLASLKVELTTETLELLRGLYDKMEDSIRSLTSIMRLLQNMRGEEAYRMLEDRVRKLKETEEEADALYRKAYAHIVSVFNDKPRELIVLKDMLELVESAIDRILEAGNYMRIIAVATITR
ncbi:MAG: hypothetical protein GSR85_09635 [Desulfurococcales archaeon]|nr:hypothetical protein [Desulfurococcales archaeon]